MLFSCCRTRFRRSAIVPRKPYRARATLAERHRSECRATPPHCAGRRRARRVVARRQETLARDGDYHGGTTGSQGGAMTTKVPVLLSIISSCAAAGVYAAKPLQGEV